ncbi:sigma-70 family RNA polymerase sigma factor [Bailinhaonella thermotolerans]|uniref:Sigma-70 family RNA polymerase sigma factor n=1 Tax=Bailinhaonella thermotolerans TaxID=1070861 RepID=A0A3A4ACW1_9ACTN|nr:sigma-70 family RNA polymerase sigma factor [Bailinhaonella thermotolerans]RJL23890.1 sigma-70 family RNA polymerase sigma factor [Bailinhaonella thermotolerans]
MDSPEQLSRHFEGNRQRLTALACQILGNSADAEDAVQDAWVRLSRPGATDVAAIANLDGWMTTVVSRTCLNKLRARAARPESPTDATGPRLRLRPDQALGPEDQALLAEQVGLALHIVLESLAPPERLAFVLHDSFGMPFSEIATVLGKSTEATRKLASRARRRVHAVDPAEIETNPANQRSVVNAFFAATRDGDLDTLLTLLHPEITFHADGGATRPAATATIRGPQNVAERAATFAIPDATFQPITMNGSAAVIVYTDQHPVSIMAFVISHHQIIQIYSLLDQARIDQLINTPG